MSIKGSSQIGGQVKIGAIISYVMIILSALYGMLVTPYLIGTLGDAEYGVYKTISSFTAALMVLDLGIGGTVMRYVSKYKATKNEDKIPNFLAMMFIQAFVLVAVVLGAGGVIFFSIGPLYSETFTSAEIEKAKLLFVILLINMALHVVQNVVNGIITGNNDFLFGNGVKLVRFLIRTAFIILLVTIVKNSVAIVLVDLCVTFAFLIFELFYVFFKLKIRVKLTKWEGALFWDSGKYTIMMFLTSIAAQVNNNLDNVIIGSISGPSFVTVYSIGLLIFAMYEQLSTSISGVMLPTVTTILEREDSNTQIQNLVVKVGRVQFLLLGAAVVGFACIGKDFINIWLGQGYEDVYIITLILMIPSLFELCVNVCLAVLRAKNMLTFRTVTLFLSTILNAIVSILFVKYWSYIGAAFGTAVSFIIGSLVVMNIYYYKKFGFHMLKIYWRIISGILPCLIISGGALFVSSRFLGGALWAFIVNILVFCIVYATTLLLFGLTKEEKMQIPIIKRYVK